MAYNKSKGMKKPTKKKKPVGKKKAAGGRSKLDMNKNGKIDKEDFKLLRARKKNKKSGKGKK